MTLLAVALGAGLTIGVLLIVFAFRPVPAPERDLARTALQRLNQLVGLSGPKDLMRRRRILVASIGGGLLGWVVSGWFVLVVLVPLAVVGLPALVRRPPTTPEETLTALETWTRTMSGLLIAGAPLESAVQLSLASTAEQLKGPVARLAARLQAQQPLERAIHLWADEIEDPLADMIAATIMIGAKRRSEGIAAALEGLAESLADQIEARQKVEAERSGPRATARFMTFLTLALGVFGFMNPTYSQSYSSPTGQVVLLLLVSAYAGSLLALQRLARGRTDPRILTHTPRAGALP